jgi:hypothetical protein
MLLRFDEFCDHNPFFLSSLFLFGVSMFENAVHYYIILKSKIEGVICDHRL